MEYVFQFPKSSLAACHFSFSLPSSSYVCLYFENECQTCGVIATIIRWRGGTAVSMLSHAGYRGGIAAVHCCGNFDHVFSTVHTKVS